MYVWCNNTYACAEICFDYPEVWSPASCIMRAQNFPQVQRRERDAAHSPTSSVEA
jgi:hypothetical protein